MAVQIAYEQITGQPFLLEDALGKAAGSLPLCYAAIVTADTSTPITFEDLLDKVKAKEYAALKSAVIAEIEDWCEIPPTLTDDTGGDAPKNP